MRLYVFDLDGTLIDSKLDLALSVNVTRKEFGLDPLAHDAIFSHIGGGARTLIHRSLDGNATEQTVDRALEFFIYYYHDHALDHTAPYPGVRAGLERLSSDDRPLVILTNKPVRISRHILGKLKLDGFFRGVYGGNSFETKKPDPLGLQTILREYGAAPEETLMVGDSPTDIETARNAGTWACGVTYGIQSHELDDAPPDFTVDSLTDLATWALP